MGGGRSRSILSVLRRTRPDPCYRKEMLSPKRAGRFLFPHHDGSSEEFVLADPADINVFVKNIQGIDNNFLFC